MAKTSVRPSGRSHASGDQSPRSNVRKQDLYLFIANIRRIMKKALLANGKSLKMLRRPYRRASSSSITLANGKSLKMLRRPYRSASSSSVTSPPARRVINVREKRGRQLKVITCFVLWPLLDLKTI
ncbi:Histone-fold containing protein [Trema orientale]|uniref:Histone-fold containing protein n=1 Tax=Trema orientale TaxID=63057 RepID=A0A2P5DDK8_TREOI|nr:Histone-fold containing protein [Trema orientale]